MYYYLYTASWFRGPRLYRESIYSVLGEGLHLRKTLVVTPEFQYSVVMNHTTPTNLGPVPFLNLL